MPVATKSSSMSSHDRLGSDDRNCLQDRRTPTVQLHEEQGDRHSSVEWLNATWDADLVKIDVEGAELRVLLEHAEIFEQP